MSTDFLNKNQSGSVSEEKNTDKDWNSDGDDEEIDMKTLSLYGPLRSSGES